MRSFVDLPGAKLLPLILAGALGACGGGAFYDDYELGSLPPAPDTPVASAASADTGPSADYPVVVGDPYVVAGKTYTPEDVLNYDEVGYLSIDPRGGTSITGEHHTLPLPSYIEVTSLESGRTILVRLERRGPMTGNFLVGLSPGAADQLGVMAGSPVRVRRVNPPEQERAMLRAGEAAAPRMDTPTTLVNVLRRKLPNGEGPIGGELAAATPATAPAASEPAHPAEADDSLALPPLQPVGSGASSTAVAVNSNPDFFNVAFPPARRQPAPAQGQPEVSGPAHGYVVQAGAFSNWENANRVARVIGGEVSLAGRLYRVRTGPFASRGEAEASLAKVRAAGYSDARIFDGG